MLKKQADSLCCGCEDDGKTKNLTWKCKSNDSHDNSKKELAAFVRKQARKELNANNKKHKTDTEEEGETPSSSDDGDDGSLNNFNFSKMDFSSKSNSKENKSDETDDFSV